MKDEIVVASSDEQIVDRVLALLTEAAETLIRHSTVHDYHESVMKIAAKDMADAYQMVAHLKQPIPRPYREAPEQGPRPGANGPRRYRVQIKLKTAHVAFTDTDPADIKKVERARFYDYGYSAVQHARAYAFAIGDWVDTVRITDRLEQMIWTYDADGNCAELKVEEG